MDRFGGLLRLCTLATLTLLGAAASAQDAGARLFDVDAAGSEVFWRVYKAGAFSRFGHNHVVSVSDLSGSIMLGEDPSSSEWELTIPVASLVVDNPELRARFGEDFASVPSEKDIEGTRGNMLSERVLNGEVYPEIHIRGQALRGSLENAELPVVIEMLGRSIELVLPGRIAIDGDTLTATGEFSLQHSDLGMEPFSVMAGALKVGPQLDFTYRIHAVEQHR